MILISEKFFHPRYLSLIAIPFAVAWLVSVFALKKGYSKILLDLVSKDMFDLKALEETDMEQLFSGTEIETQLVQTFLDSKGNRSIWYARLIKSMGIKHLDQHLLTAIKHQKDRTRVGLLELLSPKAGKEAASLLWDLTTSEKNPDIVVAALNAANRLDIESCAVFDFESLLHSHHPEIRANGLIGLYRKEPEKYGSTIASWLHSDALEERTAGIIAAGDSGEILFADRLKEMLVFKDNEPLLPFIFRGLHSLGTIDLNNLALPYLSDPSDEVRKAALSVIEIENDEILRNIISKIGDSKGDISRLAQTKIETAP
jgi:HEAT repeat protein